MCGIVGLLLKNEKLRPRIGEFMLPMLENMTERGPESTGLAIFGAPVSEGKLKYSLYAPNFDWSVLSGALKEGLDSQSTLTVRANHAVLLTSTANAALRSWIKSHYPNVHVLSAGKSIDLFKDTGTPLEVAMRYDFSAMSGTHLVGHTRMATESAVTPAHAHPFTAGEDWCLVHNGSLSNPNSIRRHLLKEGIEFETDNDTEAACRFLEWRMRCGDDLQTSLEKGFEELDGFFTFLMGTKDALALVRDPFACKPAIVAEHDDYVAIASEFRSLARLPDVENATLFEPLPERLYIWNL
jgi:methylamine---glutamate N-methyltransferase subunit A